MDVSTGEDDAFNRVFGRVCEVMLESCGAQEDTILAIEESRNFKQAQPERAPLDIEEINAEARDQHGDAAEEFGFRSGVRWAEKRHGIKQGGQHD